MKDQEFEKLMQGYRDSLGTCERTPVRHVRPSPWPRRIAVGLAATAAVAIGGVALWPRDAAAATLRRVGQAITNAKSMEVDFVLRRKGVPDWHMMHVAYQSGMWRYESNKSPAMRMTYILRDGQELLSFDRLDHATLGKASPENLSEVDTKAMDALEYAKTLSDMGHTDTKRVVTVKDHEPVAGVPTYLITLDRAEDEYHAEILVDRRTDLPLYADAKMLQTSQYGSETIDIRQDYKFNAPLPLSTFSFDQPKPVVRIEEAQAALAKRWERPIATIAGTSVRDACVTPDGTVWLAVTSANQHTLPSRLSSSGGSTYVRGKDVDPNSYSGQESLKIGGGEVMLVPFVSMNPQGMIPKQAELTFARREPQWINFAEAEDQSEALVGHSVSLRLRPEPEDRPEYFAALHLDRFGFEMGIIAWNTRAKAYEKAEKWIEAAKAYEQCAKAYENVVKYGGYRPLTEAARCYRTAGLDAEAGRAQRAADALKASRER